MEDPATVAAIMVEPIGHTGGVIDPPEEYLPILREICDRHNILLIFDEIITGIGRTGQMFAAETFGVTPDVLCIAKGLERRLRAAVGDDLPASRSPTPSGGRSPRTPASSRGTPSRATRSSCAAGIAVLREILERDLLRQRPRARAQRLRARLRGAGAEIPGHRRHPRQGAVPGDRVRARPGDQGAVSRRDGASACKVGRRALEHGLLCRFDPHWIAFGPPLVVDGRADRRDGRAFWTAAWARCWPRSMRSGSAAS